ncbi:MAG TPA: hypothetical protein VKU00_19330 [Chthonomonadaceae bacterium]|nr:hypothetical protein [Chthonomonadaceae bacterium]
MDPDSVFDLELPAPPEIPPLPPAAPVVLTDAERARLNVLAKRHAPLLAPIHQSLESGLPLPEEAFDFLLWQLEQRSAFRLREQMTLTWLQGVLPLNPAQRAKSVRTLASIFHTRKWSDHSARMMIYVGVSTAVGIILSILKGGVSSQTVFLAIFGSMLLSLFPIAPLMAIIEDARINRLRAQAMETLGKLGVPETSGLIAGAVYDASGGKETMGIQRVRKAATAVLPRVLAGLTPAYYGRLESSAVPNLCTLLGHHNEELALAALDALEKVGDGRAVLPVEGALKKRRSERLRARAAEVLPILVARREREQASQMLLRASAPQEAGEELLRAAVTTPDQAPEQLLRASVEEP